MKNQSLKTPLIAGRYYHLFNRGNNKERLFYFHGNYDFFIKKYFFYLNPVADTYCYCLLPNHFHFLIRIKDSVTDSKFVSNQLRKLFITYAMYINLQESRTGCIISKNFRRIEVNREEYLISLVRYIHLNPVKHKMTYDIKSYRYSTFYKIIHNQTNDFEFTELISWFGGYSIFLENHTIKKNDDNINNYKLED